MVARNWLLLASIGLALVGPACAIILGAHDLPEGAGGSSGTTGTGPSTSTSTSTSSGTSSSSGMTTTSWPTTGTCAPITFCRDCLVCMEEGVCKGIGADAGCGDASPCDNYVACIVQCNQGAGYASCLASCSTVPTEPGYAELKACMCAQCGPHCNDYCK